MAKGSGSEPAGSVRARVPRLARGLLAAVPAYDSMAALASEPVLIGREQADELIDILCDPDRRYPAVVASPYPEIAFDEWRVTITRVMWYLPGVASIYILDPIAERWFREGIGDAHAVWGGALRTYLPDVDPAVAEEAARHRVLSAARIVADPGRAAGIVSVLPRRLAVEAPLPAPLTGVNRRLLTRERESPGATDVAGLRSQLSRLAGDLDVALNLAETAEAHANTLFIERENALAELAEREQRVLYLDSQVRALQRRLVAVGQPSAAFQPPEEPATPPATFAELLDWVEADLSRVVFTGDSAASLNLDQRPEGIDLGPQFLGDFPGPGGLRRCAGGQRLRGRLQDVVRKPSLGGVRDPGRQGCPGRVGNGTQQRQVAPRARFRCHPGSARQAACSWAPTSGSAPVPEGRSVPGSTSTTAPARWASSTSATSGATSPTPGHEHPVQAGAEEFALRVACLREIDSERAWPFC